MVTTFIALIKTYYKNGTVCVCFLNIYDIFPYQSS